MFDRFCLTDPSRHRWVLVTGAPRSGTSYFGDILSLDRRVNSIIEPFNPDSGLPGLTARYLDGPTVDALDPDDRERIAAFFKYDLRLKTVYSARDSAGEHLAKRLFMGGNEAQLLRARFNPRACVTVIKDPIACFAVGALHATHPLDCFFLLRHPKSFVGSLRRLGWNFRVDPLLVPEARRLRVLPELSADRTDKLGWTEQAAYVWLAIARQLQALLASETPVIPVFLEEMSRHPLDGYRQVFDHLGLRWTDKVASHVRETSTASGKAAARDGVVHDYRRDASAIFAESLTRLTAEDHQIIDAITGPERSRWYASADAPDLTPEGAALHLAGTVEREAPSDRSSR